MLELWITVKAWLIAESIWIGPLTGIAAVALALRWPFKRDTPTQLAPETIDQIKPPQARNGLALTVPEFIRLRRELKADLEQELAEATDAEKEQLHARITELQTQIANPEQSLAEARKRIADLEALLDREANHIGGDRIARAKAALEQGDYSLADAIFAEIEARNNLANVVRAQGRVDEAETLYRQALEIGRATIGEGHPAYAIRLNNLAGVLVKLDRAAEARPLLEQALAIFRATLPADHPHIAETERHLAALPDD